MPEKMPASFVLCPKQKCPELKPGIKDEPVKMKEGVKHCTSPCRCRIFERPSNMPATDPWWFCYPDKHGNVIRKAKYDYAAFCVKPVLTGPGGQTYVVCVDNACPKNHKDEEIWCIPPDGECASGCQCLLFKLKIEEPRPGEPQEKKWEYVEKAGKKVKPQKGYYYECMCVRPAEEGEEEDGGK